MVTITYLFILVIVASATVLIEFQEILLTVGLFSLSGAITNSLAIHMLFEKIPLIYGSGIIEKQFDHFKQHLKQVIMEHLFNPNQVESFFRSEGAFKFNAQLLRHKIHTWDFNFFFQALENGITKSPLGQMLNLVGGKKVLQQVRPNIEQELKTNIEEWMTQESFQNFIQEMMAPQSPQETLYVKIEKYVGEKIDGLSAPLVKTIVHELIDKYLGWLVVWGAVFGGLIGLCWSGIKSFIL